MSEEPELSFELAVSQLEAIVESLERGETTLAQSLASYDTGAKLLSRCYEMLDQSERAVSILLGVDAEGKSVTAPFNASATLQAEKPTRGGKPRSVSSTPATDDTASSPGEPSDSPDPAPRSPRTRRSRPEIPPDSDRFDPPF